MAISESSIQQRLKLRRQTDGQMEIFQRFVEASGQALLMANLEGQIFFANNALCRLLGRDHPDELYEQYYGDWFDSETAERLLEEILPMVRQEGQWTGELAIMDVQGHVIPTIENIFLLRNDEDKPLCFAAVITDISERIRLEGELRTYRKHLEMLVANRTAELEKANTLLHAQIAERKEAEAERSRLAAILENTSDMVVLMTPEGGILYINEAGRSLMGWQKERKDDILKRHLADLHPQWALKMVMEEGFPGATATGVWKGETAILGYEGQEVPTSQVITAHLGVKGEIEYFSTILRDISERKQNEKILQENLHILAEAERVGRIGNWQWDLKTNDFRCSAGMKKIMDFAESESITFDQLLSRIHPDDLKRAKSKSREIFARGKLFTEEFRIIYPDGTVRYIIGRAEAELDAERNPVLIRGSAQDITERKKAEESIRENLDLLTQAERVGHTGSWKADLNMNHISMSEEVRRIWGFAEKTDVSYHELISRFHPDDRNEVIKTWQAAMEKKTLFAMEYRIVLSDGTIRYLFGSSEAIVDEQGKPVGLRGSVQDMTERKRLEEEIIKAQKLESIGTLAGGLAHDYNNLLATIMGSLEIIKMNIDEKNRAYSTVVKAEQAALAAGDLTKQLLTFSKGGYYSNRIMPVDKLLTETVRLALKGSSTKAVWHIEDDLPKVNIDENQISQAIHNIVMNARDAMSNRGIITIRAEKVIFEPDNDLKLHEGNYIRLIFRDEGPGIRADYIPKLFDPYFTTKTAGNKKGLGLGLAVCYSIMKRHNGHIQIESGNGTGTTVTLHLPAAWNTNHVHDTEGRSS